MSTEIRLIHVFFISSPEGVARYCFHPVCLSVCLSVRPIFWYFIYRLLEEISIWSLYRILIGLYSIHPKIDLHRSKVKVTGTVLCLLKVQSYHKNWAIEFVFHRHLLRYSICWNNKNWSEQRNDVTKKYVNICKTPIPKLLFLINSSKKKSKKYGSQTAPSYSYYLIFESTLKSPTINTW